jgi:hypothetical protein
MLLSSSAHLWTQTKRLRQRCPLTVGVSVVGADFYGGQKKISVLVLFVVGRTARWKWPRRASTCGSRTRSCGARCAGASSREGSSRRSSKVWRYSRRKLGGHWMPRLIRHIVCFLYIKSCTETAIVVRSINKKKEGKNSSLVWFHLSVAPVHSRSAFASTSFLCNTRCICCLHLRLICGLKQNDYDSAVRLPSGYLSLELIFTEDKKKYKSQPT